MVHIIWSGMSCGVFISTHSPIPSILEKIDITFCCCKVSKIETFFFLTIRFRNKIHCRCRSFYQETPSKGLNSTICFHFALFSIDILLKTATCYVIVLETHKKPLMFSVQTAQVFCRKKKQHKHSYTETFSFP